MEAVLALTLFAIVLGTLLAWLASRYAGNDDDAVEQLNALLPQTQCAQCGYPGCRPYAEAIVAGETDINRCTPGGQAVLHALSESLGRPVPALDASLKPMDNSAVAIIEEDACIGCALCIKACPVDAILGAAKYMHTVIADECTGCELCIEPCPVDCISMQPGVNLPGPRR